jgi:hypothetical protein
VGDAVGDKLEVTCWHERSNKSDFNLQKKKIINLTFKTQRKRKKRKRKEEKEKGEREGEKKERRGGGLLELESSLARATGGEPNFPRKRRNGQREGKLHFYY